MPDNAIGKDNIAHGGTTNNIQLRRKKMKRIKKNESTSSKGSRRNQNKIQSSVNAMACVISLKDGSAIWFSYNSATGPEGWHIPKKFLDDQKTFRNALERALGQPADPKSGQVEQMNIGSKNRDDKQMSKQKE